MKTIQPEKEILSGKEEIILSPDEYFNPDDGLVYCSKCHNPKEIWLYSPVFSTPKKGIIACLCEKEKIQKQEEEKRHRENEDKKKRLYQSSGFPEGLMKCTFDKAEDYHPDLVLYAKNYAERLVNDPGFSQGLLLYGPPGTGKTYMAACVGNYLIQSLQPVLHASVGYLLSGYNDCRFQSEINGSSAEFLKNLLNYRLIVLDDLGSEYKSEYQNSLLFDIINFLDIHQKPMVITTNISPNDLAHPSEIGRSRIYDRIIKNCLMIAVMGDDLRFKQAQDRRENERNRMAELTEK